MAHDKGLYPMVGGVDVFLVLQYTDTLFSTFWNVITESRYIIFLRCRRNFLSPTTHTHIRGALILFLVLFFEMRNVHNSFVHYSHTPPPPRKIFFLPPYVCSTVRTHVFGNFCSLHTMKSAPAVYGKQEARIREGGELHRQCSLFFCPSSTVRPV